MGKDLKGKELGVGISQIKNGKYVARFVAQNGKRIKREFWKLRECRQWLADARFENEYGNVYTGKMPTVDAWFKYWMDEIKGNTIKYSTKNIYTAMYTNNIKPLIGDMLLSDVKPMHCQNVLNQMEKKYKDATMLLTRLVMLTMFESAAENEIIEKNPVTKRVKCKEKQTKEERRVLTVEEQKKLLKALADSPYYNQYAFVLQTGIRVGELRGLRWSDIDMENRMMRICRTVGYDGSTKTWKTGEPKTKSGLRSIPLTKEAVDILNRQKENSKREVISIDYPDTIFLDRDGLPINGVLLNRILKSCCKKIGIPQISMHGLRHSFATRCIEGGMKPKTLQMILGHSDISMTMDLYVHVTSDEKIKEIRKIEETLKVI